MSLSSTQPLTKMSIRASTWGVEGKNCRCILLITLPPLCANCLEILGVSTSWSLKGLVKPVKGQLCLLTSEFLATIMSISYMFKVGIQNSA